MGLFWSTIKEIKIKYMFRFSLNQRYTQPGFRPLNCLVWGLLSRKAARVCACGWTHRCWTKQCSVRMCWQLPVCCKWQPDNFSTKHSTNNTTNTAHQSRPVRVPMLTPDPCPLSKVPKIGIWPRSIGRGWSVLMNHPQYELLPLSSISAQSCHNHQIKLLKSSRVCFLTKMLTST